MTSPALRVTPGDLHELAQRCRALAAGIAPTLPAVSASAWQASGAAASSVNAGGSNAAAAMRGRITANAGKLTTAAHEYEAMDNDGAAALAAVPQGGPGITPLVPRLGADGGAGGFGVPR
ncbi:type VII secretion target [[Mycobacterium] nativiensis]|uniref:Type VII secretion target n=1 Tax=[Mycobacterium] nativiensis TaxID=2855503 RepID=A0ABU5Y0T9_9MYCO|nr:type VII secretion target [Mycolicibacter sp. MYC340]MEB3033870.1 type VII secretion target [Mycolicibacter sp. MYC340]